MNQAKKRSHPSAPGSSRESQRPRKSPAATKKSLPHPDHFAKWLSELQAGDRIKTSKGILKVARVETSGAAKAITLERQRPAGGLAGAAILAVLALALLAGTIAAACTEPPQAAQEPQVQEAVELPAPTLSMAIVRQPSKVPEPPAPSAPAPRYELTDMERELLESVVTAEAGGEPLEGQIAVAQCILNACEYKGIRPREAVEVYQYAGACPEPLEGAVAAVAAVFDEGQTVTDEPILFFYNPDRCSSDWHESQSYVMTICCHRFFKEAPHE